MAPKARVYELAKELNVSSEHVLEDLRAMGEFVRSASSTVEPMVVERLRRHCATKKGTTPGGRPDAPPSGNRYGNPFAPSRMPLPRQSSTGQRTRGTYWDWYKGELPSGLTKFILDNYLVPHRPSDEPPPQTAYWAREVKRAEGLSRHWGSTLLDGWSFDDVLVWIGTSIDADDAVKLSAAGIGPLDIGWSYEDKGDYTLAQRLMAAEWTVEQVILEAEARRTRR